MNKSEELDNMVLRADIYADETMAKYETAWHGTEAVEVEQIEEEEDGDR